MFFRPRLGNGQVAHLEWQIRIFFLTVGWPIEDHAGWRTRLTARFQEIVTFAVGALAHLPQLYYLVANIKNIGPMLEGLAHYIVLVEVSLRSLDLVFNKQHFKELLSEFYRSIYIDKDHSPQIYRQIGRQRLPTVLYTYSFIIAVLYSSMFPVLSCPSCRILPNFELLFPFDYKPLPIYLPLLFLSIAVTVNGGCFIVAESNVLVTMILHLNARYTTLQQDTTQLHASLKGCHAALVARRFQWDLARIVRRNVELNKFADQMQAMYSFRIFVLLGLCAILLCVMGFTVATYNIYGTSTSTVYIFLIWIAGKIVELLVLGQLGSQLIEKTNELSSMYYLSNWEEVVLESSNSWENVRLMKMITLCIELNQKPRPLTGLGFFSLSLMTAVSILQGAGSYFTFLYAFRQAS